jgi:hypothetical protein
LGANAAGQAALVFFFKGASALDGRGAADAWAGGRRSWRFCGAPGLGVLLACGWVAGLLPCGGRAAAGFGVAALGAAAFGWADAAGRAWALRAGCC